MIGLAVLARELEGYDGQGMQNPLRQMFVSFMKFGYENALVHVFDGINICDVASAERDQELIWSSYITEALELIRGHDTRRYHRVQRYLRYVINDTCIGEANYETITEACQIDFAKYRHIQDRDMCVLLLARALVHEATHGAVRFSDFRASLENRLRVERLCHREENCFMQRARPDLELLVYNDSWHRELYSQSPWQRLLRRFRQGNRPAA